MKTVVSISTIINFGMQCEDISLGSECCCWCCCSCRENVVDNAGISSQDTGPWCDEDWAAIVKTAEMSDRARGRLLPRRGTWGTGVHITRSGTAGVMNSEWSPEMLGGTWNISIDHDKSKRERWIEQVVNFNHKVELFNFQYHMMKWHKRHSGAERTSPPRFRIIASVPVMRLVF